MVQGAGVLGIGTDDAAQILLRTRHITPGIMQQDPGEQQIRIVGVALQGFVQPLSGQIKLTGGHQGAGLDAGKNHFQSWLATGQVYQPVMGILVALLANGQSGSLLLGSHKIG